MKQKKGTRQSTIFCIAKIIRALLILKKVTIKELAFKADVSVDTARRAIVILRREGLVQRVVGPYYEREYVYLWIGIED